MKALLSKFHSVLENRLIPDDSGKKLILLFALILIGLRLLYIAGSINDLHTIHIGHEFQTRLARDAMQDENCTQDILACLRENNERYLPVKFQFHGFVLLNNILTWLLSSLFGFKYFLVQLTALFYLFIAYLAWALLIDRRFGKTAMIIFSLLFVFSPHAFTCSSLNLLGSHNGGSALIALMYLACFYDKKPLGKYLMLACFGSFFFLYKGVFIAFAALAIPCLLQLPKLRSKALGALLLIAGFLPMLLYHRHFGFFGHYLEDGRFHVGEQRASWFNLLDSVKFNFSVIRFPQADFHIFSFSFFPHLAAACFIVLLVFALRHVRRNLALTAILAYPLVLWLVLFATSIFARDRYFIPMYPFMLAFVALALAMLPRRIMIGAVITLMLFLVPDNLSLIKPGQMGLFRHYRGLNYYDRNLNYVSAEHVPMINWWIDNCGDNFGFFPPFKASFKSHFGRIPEEKALGESLEKTKGFLGQPGLRDSDVMAVGMALSVLLDRDDEQFAQYLRKLNVGEETEQKIRQGFGNVISDGPFACP
jgi:hypothetical protein